MLAHRLTKLAAPSLAVALGLLLSQSAFAQVQVNDPAPVAVTPPVAGTQGLYGQYWGPGLATIPGTAGGPAAVPAGAPAMTELDPTVDFANATFPGAYNNADMFVIRWLGYVTGPVTGAVTFFTNSDDGVELQVNNTVVVSSWIDQGPTDHSGTFNMTAGVKVPIMVTFYERGGGAECHLSWQYTGQARVVIPATSLSPPAFCAAPTLTATSPAQPPPALVNLNWNAVAGATGYVLSRSTTSAAAGFTVYQLLTTNSFVDTGVTYGTQYWYQVQGTDLNNLIIGAASNVATATPILPAITITPQNGLQTNENGATAVATITFNQQLPGGQTVTLNVTVNPSTEATASALGQTTTSANGNMTLIIPGLINAGSTISLTLTGLDDPVVDPAHPYTVSFTTSGFFGTVNIPPLNCVNNDNDSPGMTVSPTSGLITSESGGTATFSVRLNTRPSAAVNMTLTSSAPTEGTVSPASLQFTNVDGQAYNAGTGIGGWDVAHVVTVTGVDDSALDFAQPYTIITGPVTSADPNYNFAAPDVSCLNLDNEIPPSLPQVWGNGCGLLGLELGLPLLFAVALRRRRKS